MRRRKKPGAKEALLALSPPLKLEPTELKGEWYKYFGNNNPIHIELGMGRGRFLTTLAKVNPNINFIGLEIKEEVILVGVRKAVEEELNNMAFIWGNAGELLNYFAPREIERIYINFCDPWPKARWYKRRLTYKGYLDIYREILCPSGQIFFKTDNEALFEFTQNEFNKDQWELHDISLDLYSNPSRDIVATEYEMKFLNQGLKIYHLGATKIR